MKFLRHPRRAAGPVLLCALALALVLCACQKAEPAPSPAPTSPPTAAPTATPRPTPTPRPTATPVPTVTPRPKFMPYDDDQLAELPTGERYIPATPTPTPPPTPVPLNPRGQEIADLARSFEGCPYKYGGEDPETGFDCSGLVWYVYGQFDIPLDRTAAAQAKMGEHVPPDEIMPGDILCFCQGEWVGHVGIYLGDDWYIHAEGTGIGVRIAAVSDRTGKIETRRVFG